MAIGPIQSLDIRWGGPQGGDVMNASAVRGSLPPEGVISCHRYEENRRQALHAPDTSHRQGIDRRGHTNAGRSPAVTKSVNGKV